MKKSIFILFTAFLFSSSVLAYDQHDHKANHKAMLLEQAGALGPFTQQEDFPKSYFLIHQNLPFMVGLSLMHPKSETLKLNDQQKSKIQEIMKSTMPVVIKNAREIKQRELALANDFINQATVEDMEKQVDAIGKLRIALSKKQVRCIEKVRSILNQQQFETLISYADNAKS